MPSAADKAQLAAIQRQLRGVVSVAVRGIATGVMDAAIETTPVDTGLSAASWQAKQGGPVTDATGDRTPGGVAAARSAQSASRLQIGTWERGTLSIGSAEGNVARLNDGNVSGRLSSAGFVQRAIRRGLAVGTVKARQAATAASRRQ